MPFEKQLEEYRTRKEKALQNGRSRKNREAACPRTVDRQGEAGHPPRSRLFHGNRPLQTIPTCRVWRKRAPTDSKIAGFGAIDGRKVVVSANDFTVLAATSSRIAGKKERGAQGSRGPQGISLGLPGRGRGGPGCRI